MDYSYILSNSGTTNVFTTSSGTELKPGACYYGSNGIYESSGILNLTAKQGKFDEIFLNGNSLAAIINELTIRLSQVEEENIKLKEQQRGDVLDEIRNRVRNFKLVG